MRLLWKSQCGKKAVLHLCFVVILFCSAFPILDHPPPAPRKKKNPQPPLSPLFHLHAQSIFASLLMEITLSCLLGSQRTSDENPSAVLGCVCEDIVTIFSHCHSSGLCEEAAASLPLPPLTLCQIAAFPTRCESF